MKQQTFTEYLIQHSKRGQTVEISEQDFIRFLDNKEQPISDYNDLRAILHGHIEVFMGRKILLTPFC